MFPIENQTGAFSGSFKVWGFFYSFKSGLVYHLSTLAAHTTAWCWFLRVPSTVMSITVPANRRWPHLWDTSGSQDMDLKVPSALQMCSCLDRLDMKLYPDALDRKLEIKWVFFHPSLKLWHQCHNEGSEMLCGNLALSNFAITAQWESQARAVLCE